MEVKSASHSLQRNRSTTRVERYGSKEQSSQQFVKGKTAEVEKQTSCEEESVMLSISAAGLRRSMLLDKQEGQKKESFSHEKTLDEMAKKMKGLSSQVINGQFSVSDRLNFYQEIKNLTEELSTLSDKGTSVTQKECTSLSQKISNFTKIINDAALYRKNATSIFVESTKLQISNIKTNFDVAI